jgi:hypothetical protein
MFFPSISSEVSTEPFSLQVSRGQIAGHRALHIFGANPAVSTTLSTIWSGDSGVYAYPTVATAVKVNSTATADDVASTGARTAMVWGLDTNYDEISEVVELDGRTQVETDAEFLRVFGVQVLSAGSGATAEGTIYVGTGALDANFKPAVVYSKAVLGNNASINGFYTVPAGHAAYLTYGSMATGSAVNNKYVTGRLLSRPYGGLFYTAAIVTLLNQQADFPFEYPIRFPEKTDIEARAISTGDTFEVSTHFEIVLVKGETAPAYTVPRY